MKKLATLLLLAGSLGGCGSAMPKLPSLGFGQATAEETPQGQALYLDLIKGLQQRGLHRAALAHLDEFRRLHGTVPQATLLRAECLAEIGEPEPAQLAFRSLLRGPQAAAARRGLGLLAAKREAWPEAITEFEAALVIEPTSIRTLNNLGYALMRSGDAARAEFRLRQAAELEPENAGVRNNLALLLAATGRAAEAEQMLGQATDRPTQVALRQEASRMASTQGAAR